MSSEQSDVPIEDDADPLKGADVGETRTVRESVELHTIDFEPRVFWGSDRIGEAEVENVDVVEDEDGSKKIVVEFEGELTKALPRRWDSYREPLTEAEEKAQRRREWGKNVLRVFGVLVPLGLGVFITNHVMGQMSGTTIDGEPIQAPGIEVYVVLIGFALFFLWALQRLPGRIGRTA